MNELQPQRARRHNAKRSSTALAVALAVVILGALPGTATAALTLTDWTAVSGGTAVGTLLGTPVSLSGSNVAPSPTSNLDGTSMVFNSAAFSPPVLMTDHIYFVGSAGGAYMLGFGRPVSNPVLHIFSLGSVLTFPPGTQITRLSGTADFQVSGNTVQSAPAPPDGDGTVRLQGNFTSIPFSAVYEGVDGIYVQVGTAVPLPDRPPACLPVNATTKFETSVTLTLPCADLDGQAVSVVVTRAPAHGKLGVVQPGNKIVYTPAKGTTGPDSFVYHGVAGSGRSADTTVNVKVGKPSRILSTVTFLIGDTDRFKTLTASPIPTGAKVQVRCKGKGCPFKRKRVKVKHHRANAVSLFKHRKLRVGMVIDISITAPHRIGALKRITIRNGAPRLQALCLPPGSSKPRKSC